MSSWTQAVAQAWQLVVDRNPLVMRALQVTLEVAGVSTGVAALLGLPLGVALGLGRFRGRGAVTAVANAGLGLPPVVVGLVFVVLTLPAGGPLARLHLLFTLPGVMVVQTVLAFPVIVALTASAVRAVTPGLLDQARAFGAGRVQLATLALREARIGVLAAVIAAVGSALSEVGAVTLAGGNIEYADQTLASAIVEQVDSARFVPAMAVGILLIGLIVAVSALLTLAQYRSRRRLPRLRLRP